MDKYESRRADLKALVDSLGRGGIAAVASSIGKEPNYVSRMLYPPGKQGRKRIGEDSLDLLVAAYPEWFGEKNTEPKRPLKVIECPDLYTIPQYRSGGSMGNGLELPDQPGIIENWSVSREWLNKNVRNFTSAGNLCIVTGFGPSMQPLFNPGDPLLVDIGIKSVVADGIYFFRVGSEGFVKQLQKIPTPNGVKYIAKSKNPDYDTFEISDGMDFEVLGRVVRVWCGTDF